MHKEDDVIDLRELIGIFLDYKKYIIIIPITFAIIAGLVSMFLIKPTYEATTTLMVNKGKSVEQALTTEDLNFGRQIIYTYAEIAKSNAVLDPVRNRMKIKNDEEIDLKISPLKDTQILSISVRDKSPIKAKTIANLIAQTFSREVTRIAKVDNVQIVDVAKLPEEPVKPNKKLNVVIAFVLGLGMTVGAVLLKEALDNTVKTEKDLPVELELNVIGKIPKYDIEGQKENGKKLKSNSKKRS